jgi:choline dehydrogenase-like flavoprotein
MLPVQLHAAGMKRRMHSQLSHMHSSFHRLGYSWTVVTRYTRDQLQELWGRRESGRSRPAASGGCGNVCTGFHETAARLRDGGECLPGIDGKELPNFVKTRAWGHHASCTCAIGTVLDKDFRVIGAPGHNLRVVDASVFPKIPGYFIILPIHLIAEKTADGILQQYNAVTMSG